MDWYPLKPHVRLRRWKGSALGYCIYCGLCDHAFDNGGLPDSPKRAAALVGLDDQLDAPGFQEAWREAWAQFKAESQTLENGRLMPKDIIEAEGRMNALTQKRADAGRAGGHRSGETRRAKKSLTPENNGQHPDPAHVEAIKIAAQELEKEMSQVCHEPEGALASALEAVFPAETAPHKFLELGQFVLKVKGCPPEVLRWRDWFRARYPRKAATIFTFKDSFPEMLAEPKQLPTGARFIIATCFNLSANEHARLTKDQFNQAMTQGDLLAQLVGLSNAEQWQAQGFLPKTFQAFWRSRVKDNSYPSPESVVKYWRDFLAQLPSGGNQ